MYNIKISEEFYNDLANIVTYIARLIYSKRDFDNLRL